MSVMVEGVQQRKASQAHLRELAQKAQQYVIGSGGAGGLDRYAVESDDPNWVFVWSIASKIKSRKVAMGAEVVTYDHGMRLAAANLGVDKSECNKTLNCVRREDLALLRVPIARFEGKKASLEIKTLTTIDADAKKFKAELSNEGFRVPELDENGVPIRTRGTVHDKGYSVGIQLTPAQLDFLNRQMAAEVVATADTLVEGTGTNDGA